MRHVHETSLNHSLRAIPVISLSQHNLFCHIRALLHGAKTKYVSKTSICFLISMSNDHATPSSDIEACQTTCVVYDCDKANVIGKNIHISGGRHSNSNFELCQMNMKNT